MSEPPKRSLPRRVLNRLEVDRAVFYAIVSRGWQFAAGPITILLMANFFSPEVQGYYYTFWGVVGLQMFFELGLPQAIVNFASHEWEQLEMDETRAVRGRPEALSRLRGLTRASFACYAFSSFAFWIIVTAAGWIMFSRQENNAAIHWQVPWLLLTALNSFAFGLTPLLTVLEGCNQVQSVYKMHLARAVLGNVAVWIGIPLGTGLWTPAVATAVRLICECYLIGVPFRHFFVSVFRPPQGPTIDWRREVWPFQWRIMIKGFFGYFNAYLMNPVIFHYHGSVVAGQLGMVWQVLSALQGATASWVKARVPQLGMLVSRGDYRELDRVFFRVGGIAFAVMLVGCGLFVGFDTLLYVTESRFAARLLSPLPTALLALGTLLALIPDFQWAYIHAHRRSPHLLLSIAGAVFSGGLIWGCGRQYGAVGVGIAFLANQLLFALPVWTTVWWQSRQRWHAEDPK